MKFVLQPLPHQSRANCIKAIQDAPDGYVVEIMEPVKEKTDLQTRALFGVAYPPIMAAMGLQGAKEKDEIHEYFCGEFFGWQEYQILNKRKVKPVRTTTTDEHGKRKKINTIQMAELYDFIQRRCAEFGIVVPDPDPLWWLEK